ncbi:MAG TPA: hypothetical protein VGG06_10300, partial [Thermoanaerobaculia bacterium]
GHPISGYRFWRTELLPNGDILVQTGALEHDRTIAERWLASIESLRRQQFKIWEELMFDAERYSRGTRDENTPLDNPFGSYNESLRNEFEMLLGVE